MRPPVLRLSAITSATLAMLAIAAPASSPAQAQAATGTGGGPTSTVTAPHTSAVGRTMPPANGAADAATADDRRQRTPEQKQDDKITKGICIGCAPK